MADLVRDTDGYWIIKGFYHTLQDNVSIPVTMTYNGISETFNVTKDKNSVWKTNWKTPVGTSITRDDITITAKTVSYKGVDYTINTNDIVWGDIAYTGGIGDLYAQFEPGALYTDSADGTITGVIVSANTVWTLKVTPENDFLTPSVTAGTAGVTSLTFKKTKNDTDADRVAEVSLYISTDRTSICTISQFAEGTGPTPPPPATGETGYTENRIEFIPSSKTVSSYKGVVEGLKLYLLLSQMIKNEETGELEEDSVYKDITTLDNVVYWTNSDSATVSVDKENNCVNVNYENQFPVSQKIVITAIYDEKYNASFSFEAPLNPNADESSEIVTHCVYITPENGGDRPPFGEVVFTAYNARYVNGVLDKNSLTSRNNITERAMWSVDKPSKASVSKGVVKFDNRNGDYTWAGRTIHVSAEFEGKTGTAYFFMSGYGNPPGTPSHYVAVMPYDLEKQPANKELKFTVQNCSYYGGATLSTTDITNSEYLNITVESGDDVIEGITGATVVLNNTGDTVERVVLRFSYPGSDPRRISFYVGIKEDEDLERTTYKLELEDIPKVPFTGNIQVRAYLRRYIDNQKDDFRLDATEITEFSVSDTSLGRFDTYDNGSLFINNESQEEKQQTITAKIDGYEKVEKTFEIAASGQNDTRLVITSDVDEDFPEEGDECMPNSGTINYRIKFNEEDITTNSNTLVASWADNGIVNRDENGVSLSYSNNSKYYSLGAGIVVQYNGWISEWSRCIKKKPLNYPTYGMVLTPDTDDLTAEGIREKTGGIQFEAKENSTGIKFTLTGKWYVDRPDIATVQDGLVKWNNTTNKDVKINVFCVGAPTEFHEETTGIATFTVKGTE